MLHFFIPLMIITRHDCNVCENGVKLHENTTYYSHTIKK